jgi:hypothetical protein
MATTGTGFDVPIALNLQRKQDKLEEKHRLSDEELQGKIGELVDNRKAIQAKLPTLLDEKGQPTPEYNQAIQSLTSNAQALREIYHPNTNPSAVAKYGHMLTDALHITNPADRQQKDAAKQASLKAGDQRTAQSEAAAAPPAPKTPIQLWQAYQDTYKRVTSQDVPPELAAQWARTSGRVTEQKETPEKYFPQLQTTEETLPDGTKKIHYWRVPMSSGDKPEEVDFNGQTMAPKQHPSSAMEAQAIRAKYGKDLEQLSPDQAAEAITWFRNLNTPDVTSTGNQLVYDQNNQAHQYTHTSTSHKTFPGAKGPSGAPPAPAGASPTSPNGGTGAKKTPAELRKEADKLNSRSSATPKPPKSPIGPALDFYKITPEITAAKKDVDAASALVDIAHRAENAPMSVRAGLQRQVAASIQNTLEKRFNQTAFDNLIHNYGIANNFQTWLDKQETGALPDPVFKQLVAIADSNLQGKKVALQSALAPVGGAAPSAGGSTPDAGGKSLADRLHEAYGAKTQ